MLLLVFIQQKARVNGAAGKKGYWNMTTSRRNLIKAGMAAGTALSIA